jgi:hypothetical protein
MIFTGRVKELFAIDVTKLQGLVPFDESHFWAADTGRQTRNIQHKETLNIPLMTAIPRWDGTYNCPIHKHEVYGAALLTAVEDVATQVANHRGGKINQATLINLGAGKQVYLHKDNYPLNKIHRCHVPLTTNDKCIFTVMGEDFLLKPGFAYELNNMLPHKAVNFGETSRVHLLVDILPYENN